MVVKRKPGRSRDAERIITGADGSAWYTAACQSHSPKPPQGALSRSWREKWLTHRSLLSKNLGTRRAFKVRAYPDAEQAVLLRRTFGCVRLVWNKTLADRQRRYTAEQKSTSYEETDAALSAWKKTDELAFLSEVSSVALQQTLRHQHGAFQSFFKGIAKYPRFKCRHARQSAHYTRSAFRIKSGITMLRRTSLSPPGWRRHETPAEQMSDRMGPPIGNLR